jgi:hypothetical protein
VFRRVVASSALGLVREFSDRRRVPMSRGRSGTQCASLHPCRLPSPPLA